MAVPVVEVGVMRARMSQVRVPVPVSMRLAGRVVRAVLVLVVLVVGV